MMPALKKIIFGFLFVLFFLLFSNSASAQWTQCSQEPYFCLPCEDEEKECPNCAGASSYCSQLTGCECGYSCYDCDYNNDGNEDVCDEGGTYTDCAACDENYGTRACWCTTNPNVYQIEPCGEDPDPDGGGSCGGEYLEICLIFKLV